MTCAKKKATVVPLVPVPVISGAYEASSSTSKRVALLPVAIDSWVCPWIRLALSNHIQWVFLHNHDHKTLNLNLMISHDYMTWYLHHFINVMSYQKIFRCFLKKWTSCSILYSIFRHSEFTAKKSSHKDTNCLGDWYLVGGFNQPSPLKNGWSEWKSVGLMTFPTEWKKIIQMFQTTNQPSINGWTTLW